MNEIPTASKIDMSRYVNRFGFGNKLRRATWGLIWVMLFRPSLRLALGFRWRRFLLRCFGAKIGVGVRVYPNVRIWAPWNLEMGDYSCLGQFVDCYSVDKITIGANAMVSQYSFLCSAGHDISDPNLRLTTAPIVIGEGAWVCADVFVAPGVTIGDGAVAAARAVVTKNVEPWTVVGGNPAKFIKKRALRSSPC